MCEGNVGWICLTQVWYAACIHYTASKITRMHYYKNSKHTTQEIQDESVEYRMTMLF